MAQQQTRQRPQVSLIVAMGRNRTIGANGAMPWHLPEDLRWFKKNTLGKPILMGRRTFDSIGRALPGRDNLVLTRHPEFATKNVIPVSSIEQAMATVDGEDELMVIGGAQVYKIALPLADRLFITHIEAKYDGDTHFPEVDWPQWRLVSEDRHSATTNTPACRFSIYDRVVP